MSDEKKEIPCSGGCGKTKPLYETDQWGQKYHIFSWICGPCHKRVCGYSYVVGHDCKVDLE